MSGSHSAGECDDALTKLYFFLDGELTDERRSAIQEHLEKCPPCFEAFDFEAELRMVIAQRCRERVPDSLRHRIVEALQTEAGSLGVPPSPFDPRRSGPGPGGIQLT